VAINRALRARENPSALACFLAKLAAIRRYERQRTKAVGLSRPRRRRYTTAFLRGCKVITYGW
jgi:hypothetical protein